MVMIGDCGSLESSSILGPGPIPDFERWCT